MLNVIDLDPEGKQAVQAYLPRFGFLLDDLSAPARTSSLTGSSPHPRGSPCLVLKTAPGNPRITALLRRWEDQLRAMLDQPGGGEAFLAILTYIQHVSETPGGELHDLAASLGPDAEEAYVTTAEMLRAEGEARGKASLRRP